VDRIGQHLKVWNEIISVGAGHVQVTASSAADVAVTGDDETNASLCQLSEKVGQWLLWSAIQVAHTFCRGRAYQAVLQLEFADSTWLE
jgi:hypothetical protein